MSDEHPHTHEDLTKIHPLAVPFLWLANPKVERGFIWIPLIGMIITILLGLVYPQKHPAPWDKLFFGSWAVIGFFAYSFVVMSAEPLFKLLARDEDYYGEGSTDLEIADE
ncbi:MAG: hypothetical protein ACPGVT_10075 [Maricaulaceae bacterium]